MIWQPSKIFQMLVVAANLNLLLNETSPCAVNTRKNDEFKAVLLTSAFLSHGLKSAIVLMKLLSIEETCSK